MQAKRCVHCSFKACLSLKSESRQVFFYKAHIFAGQARPANKHITDFAWLTKEEIESYVDKDYWEGTKDMLSDF